MTLCYIAPAHCVRLRKGARKLRRQCDFATGLWSARAAHRGALLGALALLFFVLPARAQISPGPLSRAHQPLSGALQCTSCHKIAGQATFKCLDCHTEIASRLGQGRGYHAAVVNKAEGSQDCVRCHSEHNGENFALIRWEPTLAAFDHSKTGYPLEGKHAGLTCNKCHSAGHIAATEQASLKMKDLNRTFLGVARDCTTCHRDEHLGRLGPNCLACHTYNDWKTVPKFDHSRTRYPLTGAHVPVACQKCHLPGPDG